MAKSHSKEHEFDASEARKALAEVSDALEAWREDLSETTASHAETIADKMADAARNVGWPPEIVDASKEHLKQMSRMQLQMLDRLIEAWQQQLKSPMPNQFAAALQVPMPGMELQGAAAMAGLASKPMEIWMQAALAWQRNLTSAFTLWSDQAASARRQHRSH